MKRIFHQFSALLLVFLVAPWPQAYAQAPEQGAPLNTFAWDTLEIVTESGRRHPFRVEMAITPSQQAQGLQWRKVLADDAGMLFDFGASKPTAFWMLNTYLSLDMIFIASGGKIDKIARATKPLSLAAIASDGPVRAVLEVRAGTAARLGIQPGDRVEHRIFH
ncbi:MAG: DUF192 domain-containing protein [Proteobacteria bacterium]|nr:DUF192 domain-containing protein [Pseudomonadota bacterium]